MVYDKNLLGCPRRGIPEMMMDYKGLVNREMRRFQQYGTVARLSKMLAKRKK